MRARRVPAMQPKHKKPGGRNHSIIGTSGIRNSNGNLEMHGRNLPDRLLFVIPIAISLMLSRYFFSIPHAPGETSLHVLVYAGTACFAALLLVPVGANFSLRGLLALSRRCAAIVLVFVIAVFLDSRTRGAIGQILPLASMLFLLTIVVLAPVFRFSSASAQVRQIVFVVLATLFAIPLWLGPLAEQAGQLPALPSVLVGLNPLSALAVSLDVDYLRSSWFYQNSVLGSLRYEYVAWSVYMLILATVVAGFGVAAAMPCISRVRDTLNRILIQSGNGVTDS